MKPTNPEKLFPLFLTTKLAETKRYYTEKADFKAVVDMDMYLQLESPEPGAPHICFMRPDAFPDGKARPAFGGQGVIVSVPTKDADAKHASLAGRGAELLSSAKPVSVTSSTRAIGCRR